MAPYPDESALYTLDPNDEAAYEAAYAEFEAQYDTWWDDVYARRNLDNHAAGLADYLTSGAAQFLSGAEGENRALSPVNVYMALAMLAELTEGESRAQLLELLGAEDIEALRETAGDIWNAAYRDDGAITSILASSVWLREDMDYKQEAMDALAKYYYASSYSGEMGSGEYDEAYRAWLNEQTPARPAQGRRCRDRLQRRDRPRPGRDGVLPQQVVRRVQPRQNRERGLPHAGRRHGGRVHALERQRLLLLGGQILRRRAGPRERRRDVVHPARRGRRRGRAARRGELYGARAQPRRVGGQHLHHHKPLHTQVRHLERHRPRRRAQGPRRHGRVRRRGERLLAHERYGGRLCIQRQP